MELQHLVMMKHGILISATAALLLLGNVHGTHASPIWGLWGSKQQEQSPTNNTAETTTPLPNSCRRFTSVFEIDKANNTATFAPDALHATLRNVMALSPPGSPSKIKDLKTWMKWLQFRLVPYPSERMKIAAESIFDSMDLFPRCVNDLAQTYEVEGFNVDDARAFKKLSDAALTPKTKRFYGEIGRRPFETMLRSILERKGEPNDKTLAFTLLKVPNSKNTGELLKLITKLMPSRLKNKRLHNQVISFIANEQKFRERSEGSIHEFRAVETNRQRQLKDQYRVCDPFLVPSSIAIAADNEIVLEGLLDGLEDSKKCQCKSNYLSRTEAGNIPKNVAKWFDSIGC